MSLSLESKLANIKDFSSFSIILFFCFEVFLTFTALNSFFLFQFPKASADTLHRGALLLAAGIGRSSMYSSSSESLSISEL